MKKSSKNIFKLHGYHVIFSLTIIITFFMLLWWIIFMYKLLDANKTQEIHQLNLQNLYLQSLNQTNPQKFNEIIGEFSEFEFSGGGLDDLKLVIKPAVLTGINYKFNRKKRMILFESLFLLLFFIITLVLLFKYVRLYKKTNREIHLFFSRITHEIKTPITSLKIFLQSLKKGTIQKKELDEFIQLALNQVDQQELLANKILTYTSMEGSVQNTPPELESVFFSEYLTAYFKNHPISLSSTPPNLEELNINPRLKVFMNRSAMKVILDNLIDNAIKYGPSALHLQIIMKETAQRIRLQIIDNGPGIPEKDRIKVFHAYKRSIDKHAAGIRGTGLGLFISKKLAIAMKGDLLLLPSPSSMGSLFEVRLQKDI